MILTTRFSALGLALMLFTAPLGPAQQPESSQPHCRRPVAGAPPVRWLRPQSERDRMHLDAWCASVGAPTFFDAPRTDDEPGLDSQGWDSTALDSLVIVSWNTHVGGGDVLQLVDSLRAGRWTAGEPVRHFVLLLQEVYRVGAPIAERVPDLVPERISKTPPSGERHGCTEVARRLGLSLFYVPSMLNGKPTPDAAEDRGNAILSTLRLFDPTAIELPFESQRRVAVWASVRGTTTRGTRWELQVCSAHLDNHTAWPRVFASFGSGRLRQARFLVDALPPGPTVLGGDFNTWMLPFLERTIPYLHARFPQTAELAAGGTYSRRLLPDRRVDYLFFELPGAEPVRYRRLENRFSSDHHPLIAVVPLAARFK